MENKVQLYEHKETSLRDYLRIVFKYKAVVLITIIIVMSLVYIDREVRTKNIYMASVKMLILGQSETESEFYDKKINVRTLVPLQGEFLKSRTIIERVVKTLKLDQRPVDEELQNMSWLQATLASARLNELKSQVEEMETEGRKTFLFKLAVSRLMSNVNISYESDLSPVFMINIKDINPNAAVVIANSVSRSLIIYNIEQQITELKLKYGDKHSTIRQLQMYVADLYKTLDGKVLPDLEALGPGSVKIIEQAQRSFYLGDTSNARLILAFLASIFLSILMVFIFDFIDYSLKSPQDIERYLNISFIGSIPKRKPKDKLIIDENNSEKSDYDQSFQNLSEQLYVMAKDKKIKTMLITDFEASKDSNSIIVNLGRYLSHHGGHKVLIIDADLRNPLVSKILKISDSPGLLEVLKEEISFEGAVQDMGNNLNVLPASKSKSNPIFFLDSSKMIEVLNMTGNVYDLVLIISPDIKHFSDAVILSLKTDSTVLIVNEGKTNWQVAKRLISPLKQENINIIGAILNDRTYSIPKIIYELT